MAYTPNPGQATSPLDATITTPGAFNTAQFGSVGGQIATEKVVSTLYDYNPFSILRNIHERHNHEAGIRLLWKAFGWSRGVNAPTTGHYEAEWKDSLVKVGSIITASTGAGTNVVLALHTDMMYNASQTVSGAARQASYPRIGDIIYLPDGKSARVTAKNVTTTPHQITVTPLLSTVDLAGSITAGQSYFIASNAHGEGSNIPEGVLPRLLKYTNTFQIVKEACGSTGSDLTNQLFVNPIQNQDGSIFLRLDKDMMFRFEKRAGGALLWGQPINNITEFNAEVGFDINVKGTEGLIFFIETNGYEDLYTAGSYSTADLYAITGIYDQEQAGTNILFTHEGYGIFVETEQVFSDFFSNDVSPALMKNVAMQTGIPAEDMQPFESSDFVFYSGFRGAKLGGYYIHFKKIWEFNEAVGAGAAGYNWSKTRIFMPYGSTVNRANGATVPFVGYEYKQLGNYSRETVIADFGGAGVAGIGGILDTPVNGWDLRRKAMISEIAGHYACPNLLVIQKPDA